MIGIKEIGIGVLLLGIVAIWGKKAILKTAKDFFGIKKELKDISEGKEVKTKG